MRQTLRDMSSEQLKEMRRQRAAQWFRRPQMSLRSLLFVVGWIAICSAFYALAPLLGVAALAISSLWLVCVPSFGSNEPRSSVTN